MRPGSPGRIAGVQVGEVETIEHTRPGAQTATITMAIKKHGRPIHKDARAEIRPRIFLEGNFFVDLQPGTPSSPEAKSGATLPITQTANPVQFDQVLGALRADVRENLKGTFLELGRAQQAGAGRAFNRSLEAQRAAYRWSAVVADALLGERPGDLGRLVRDTGKVAGAFNRDPEALGRLVTDFNRVAGALAASEGDLRSTIRELPVTLRTAMPALTDLNDAFPAVRTLAREARPAVRSLGPAARELTPLVRQLRGLVSRRELRGLSRDLRGASQPLATLARDLVPALEQVRLISSCFENVLVPYGLSKVEDKNFPASGPVHQEVGKYLPGLAGESRSFDANGMWFKVLGSGGFETFDLGNGLFGSAAQPVAGVNPPADRTLPPFRPDVPCETQEIPDLRTNPGGPPREARRATTPALKQAVRERTERARKIGLEALRLQQKAQEAGR